MSTVPSGAGVPTGVDRRRLARARGACRRPPYQTCLAVLLTLLAGACRTTAPVTAPPVAAPVVPVEPTWGQKMGWIVRLEDARILRDPSPPLRPVLREATATAPAVLGPPPPADLVALTTDREARVRARAALAIGRAGLPDGIAPLGRLLDDPDVDVRQQAAFALGLIGDTAARPLLLRALADASPLVQGRAAEGLGLIGDRADAQAIAGMVTPHLRDGALAGLDPDDLRHPLTPAIDAVRLGLFALARLGSYEALAPVVLDAAGQPVSAWWPVAYSLQRVGDARANGALLALLDTPGRYTAAFAARGLARSPSPDAIAALLRVVERRQAPDAVIIQAMRALAAASAPTAAMPLLTLAGDTRADRAVRDEAIAAFAAAAGAGQIDLLLELLAHPAPPYRAAAMRALARLDPSRFLSVLASLDPDDDPAVRRAQAEALGTLPAAAGVPRLRAMLDDQDARVIPAVLTALVAAGAPGTEAILAARLQATDFAVRGAAATALADLKASAAVPALVTASRASLGDPEYVARAAILAAIHRLDPAAARPLLLEALRDRDWAVRVRSATLLRESGGAPPDIEDTMRPAAPPRDVDDPAWQRIVVPPFAPRAYLETTRGTIEIALAVIDAPLTVENFVTLARKGFFDGRPVHRVVPDFVVQDGDPRGDGEGGPGYTIRDELNTRPYLRGTVGMALDWRDTGGSQFFITHSPQPHLDARYTAFGDVVAGMDVVDQLSTGDVVQRVWIWDGVTPP